MGKIFEQLLLEPIINLLIIFYNSIALNDFGIAIILVTLLIRIILSPLSLKAVRSQTALQKLQPQVKEIQEKYKDDKQKQAEATMVMYKENNVNPFSGCVPLLIQLPILIALYRVSITSFEESTLAHVYDFVTKPEMINTVSLKIIDLTKRSIPLALLAGMFQFIQSKLSLQRHSEDKSKSGNVDIAQSMGKQMLYFFPVITIIISIQFPAGLALYWITTTLFSIAEQTLINKRMKLKTPTIS